MFLSGVKGDFGDSGVGGDVSVDSGCSGGVGGDSGGSDSSSERFFATIFFNAEREKKIGSFGDWI